MLSVMLSFPKTVLNRENGEVEHQLIPMYNQTPNLQPVFYFDHSGVQPHFVPQYVPLQNGNILNYSGSSYLPIFPGYGTVVPHLYAPQMNLAASNHPLQAEVSSGQSKVKLQPVEDKKISEIKVEEVAPKLESIDQEQDYTDQKDPEYIEYLKLPQLPKSENRPKYMFKYPKKNAESNIINQIFSFISVRTKSEEIVRKFFKNDRLKICSFYELVKELKKKNKKYINRDYIKNLILMTSTRYESLRRIPLRQERCSRDFTLSEFSLAIRTLVEYYLTQKCVSTIITSRKLDRETMREHLNRRREVRNYILTKINDHQFDCKLEERE